MDASVEELSAYCEANPEIRDSLEEIQRIDSEQDGWEFDAVDIETGAFGELVSKGLIEQSETGYQVTDPDLLASLLDESRSYEDTSVETDSLATRVHSRIANVHRRRIGHLLIVLAILFLFRITAFSSVFQRDYVLLLGNDAYFYRYWLLEVLTGKYSLSSVPEGIEQGEPLLVFVLRVAASIAGGSVAAAEYVLALYPVVAALLCGIAVYVIGRRLVQSHRVGIASVLFLAVMPAHGYRTAIGFADHHAFDVAMLSITIALLSVIETTTTPWKEASVTQTGIALLGGIVIAAQVLAWNAAPLLLLPLPLYGVSVAILSVAHDRSPLKQLWPVIIMTTVGGIAAVIVHVYLGWQSPNMVLPPVLVAIGLVGVALVSTFAYRSHIGIRFTAGGTVVIGTLISLVTLRVFPSVRSEAIRRFTRLLTGAGKENIFEAQSILSGDFGLLLAPLIFVGLAFFLLPIGIPWGFWHAWQRDRPGWLLISTYASVLLILSLLEARFAGHLSVPTAIISAVGFVWLLSRILEFRSPLTTPTTSRRRSTISDEQTETQTVNRRQLLSTGFIIFLLIGGLGGLFTPIRTTSLTYDTQTATAIDRIDTYATEHNMSYPENYVLSSWGMNRAYNAMVNGESRSYGYARSNYASFLKSTDTNQWYTRLTGRVGFVTIREIEEFSGLEAGTHYKRLYEGYGVNTHYRLIYAGSKERSYAIVPGTVINGTTDQRQVELSGRMEVEGQSVMISRDIPVEGGRWSVRLSTPGQYTIANRTVQISESDIHS